MMMMMRGLALLVTFTCGYLVQQGHSYTPLIQNATVWPLPKQLKTGDQALTVSKNFHFECAESSPAGCPAPLPDAFERYISTQEGSRIIFVAGEPSQETDAQVQSDSVDVVTVSVEMEAPLDYGVVESYTIEVTQDGSASIKAVTQWGALRAMESLSQLIWWNEEEEGTVYHLQGVPVSISDSPRFLWRGVLIDSSRHFLSKVTIKHVLDTMSFVKYNVLHWHLTDDQSWPLVSTKYPNFTKNAAYRPYTIYNHADVEEIVAYAFNRGIRIVPEIDMPAHASSWGKAYPQLTIQCSGHQTLLDPTDTDDFNVYQVFDGLMKEFDPLFNSSSFFHIGGDEVRDTYCWEHSDKVQSWMKTKGMTTVHEVRQYFEDRVQKIVRQNKRTPILWEEVYDDGYHIDKTTIVNAWLGSVVRNVTADGLKLIYNYGWYLDQQNPPGGSHYLWEDTWTNFWLNEPIPKGLSPSQQTLVLGGEASQWGEQVTGTNIDSRMWPRACGAAERLWSPPDDNLDGAWPRLAGIQCHLAQRGVGAGPVRPSADYGFCALTTESH